MSDTEEINKADPEEITIIVHEATGLKSKLGGGHKFFVLFGLSGTKYQTSVVVDPNCRPVWNEENVVTVNNMKDEVFLIVREKDHVLGQILVPISSVNEERGQLQKRSLQPHKKCNKPHGELSYECFVSKRRDKNSPLPEKSAQNNKSIGKKKFSLNIPGKKSGKQLEKITEVDSFTSSEQNDVEEITLEELIIKNASNKKTESEDNQSESSIDREAVNKEEADSGSPLKQNGTIEGNQKTSDNTENASFDQMEGETEAQDTYEKSKKKRFSLKFLKRKKLLNQTKKAFGHDADLDIQPADYQNDETDSIDEILEQNSNTLEEIDKASEKSDLTSLSSMNSNPKDTETNEEKEVSVNKIFYTENSYIEKANDQVDNEGNKDNTPKAENPAADISEVAHEPYESENNTTEENAMQDILDEVGNKDIENKSENDMDTSQTASYNEPTIIIETGAEVKKKKKFSLKLKKIGSGKSTNSPLHEGKETPSVSISSSEGSPSDQHNENKNNISGEKYKKSVSDEVAKDKNKISEKGTDLTDTANDDEPVIIVEIDTKPIKKKRSNLKQKISGSDKSALSPSGEGGKPPYLSTTERSSSEATPDKDKAKWKLNIPFLDKEGKQPQITKCTPNKSPVDEPTKVCIEGLNLGTGTADILALKVAGCDCLDTLEFESSEKIYCKTHFQFESHTGPVEIITKSGGQGTLEDGFTFFDEIEKYVNKHTKSVTFQAEIETDTKRYNSDQADAEMRATDDMSSLVLYRPKIRKLSRSSSATELTSIDRPEEPTESMHGVRMRRRLSEATLRPRRKAPPVPTEEEIFSKSRSRGRRASESAVKLGLKGPITLKDLENLARGHDMLHPKKKAPAPPQNASAGKTRLPRPVSLPVSNSASGPGIRPKSLPPVLENEDVESREELLEKIKKLEVDKAALEKDNTRLRKYIDSLVSRVMERCPTALLQDNHWKTNLFL